MSAKSFEVSLPAWGLQGGTVELRTSLRLGKRELSRTIHQIPVISLKKPQVVIDETGATQINGELFFPIGIYRAGFSDLRRIVDLGFNCCQGWGTELDSARKFLDADQEAGLKVLLEMSSFLRGKTDLEGMRKIVQAFSSHPALLTWYTVDEPSGEMVQGCQAA